MLKMQSTNKKFFSQSLINHWHLPFLILHSNMFTIWLVTSSIPSHFVRPLFSTDSLHFVPQRLTYIWMLCCHLLRLNSKHVITQNWYVAVNATSLSLSFISILRRTFSLCWLECFTLFCKGRKLCFSFIQWNAMLTCVFVDKTCILRAYAISGLKLTKWKQIVDKNWKESKMI